jgi:ribosomal protein S18 acetylase RimI-like enzyme
VTSPFRIDLLDQHDRKDFDCGNPALTDYFQLRASQDVRRRIAFCYVAVDLATDRVAGFYTLAACGIMLSDLPATTAKRLPRYPSIPAVRIGRLAVDRRFQGNRLGGALLYDGLSRTAKSGVAAFAVIVDAKDEQAVGFYEHHGFRRLETRQLTLFLPINVPLIGTSD